MESILTSIKKMLGITEEDEYFDGDLIIHINTELSLMKTQLGVGPSEGFIIKDKYDTWDSVLSNQILLEPVKTYIYLKVRLVFDPPASSTIIEVINRNIDKIEWFILHAVENELNDESEV